MVTVYTELSIKVQKHKLATLNHNQQENSNLIMPFLVQKDNKMIRGLTIRMKDSKKKTKKPFLPRNAVHVPQMHKALFV